MGHKSHFAHAGHPNRNQHTNKGHHQKQDNKPAKPPVPGNSRGEFAGGWDVSTNDWLPRV